MTKGIQVRKAVVAVIAALTAFAVLAPFAPGASAASNYTQTRYAGSDRFDTAALIASAIAEATPTAVLARADIFPDALTGGFAAAANDDGPLLLTRSDAVPPRTMQALQDENVDNVILLGGTAAINSSVEAQLTAAGYNVSRIAGPTRYHTAIQIAENGAGIIGTIDGQRAALISNGLNFPDALAGAPLSFAAGLPSLLTPPNLAAASDQGVFNETVDAMNRLNIDQVYILGGPAAVSQGVEDELRNRGFGTTRLAGGNRSGTSVEIFEFGLDKNIYTNRRFGLARGDAFPDALAYGPLGGRPRTSPAPASGVADTGGQANGLLLAASHCTLSNEVENFILAHNATWTEGEILGGPAAICETVAQQVRDAATTDVETRATVTVSSTNVERGGQITGRITGQNIDRVTVSGCGFTNETVNRDAEGDFALTLPQSQTADCTLTFTTTFDDGTTQTDQVAINVTEPAGNATATIRPELVNATVGATSTTGTLVTYCFDEEVTGATTPQSALFHVYTFDGDTQYDGSGTPTITANNNCVDVNFATITTASNLRSNLSVATVDFGAVTDNEGSENPIGDAPIGAGQQTTLAAGQTAGPDLLSVTDCAAEPTGTGADTDAIAETRCTFTFDERAYTVDPGGFHLVLLTGEQIDCVAVSGVEGGMPADRAVADADTTIVAECQQTANSGIIATSAVARGFVDENTVSDDFADQSTRNDNNTAASTFAGANTVGCNPATDLDPLNDCAGNLNPLQATDAPDGTTPEPDLVSATLLEGDTTSDSIVYTFDETVQAAGLSAVNFCYYVANGDQTCGTGTAVNRGADDTTVVVTFANDELSQAVGASVRDSAVRDVNGLNNDEDEEGMANANQSATAAGRTDNPDLTGVAVQTVTDQSGTTFRATYTFDEDIDQATLFGSEASAIQAGDFFLIGADGTRYVATACETRTVGEGSPAGTEDTDNQVRCTSYAVAATNDTSTGVVPSSAALMQAVLGTVDDGAVTEEVGAGTNPEGAELTTGGTGTPSA